MKSINKHTEIFYLETEFGPLFAIYHLPQKFKKNSGDILYIHPLGEEMNKSRRMVALQASEFSKNGIGVLQIDLFGCGDSSGEFDNARWDIWIKNIDSAIEWLNRRGGKLRALWGLRLGCLLILDYVKRYNISIENLLLWQPIVSGETFIKQFLRFRIASQFNQKKKDTTEELRHRLSSGKSVEIIGYEFNSELYKIINALCIEDMLGVVKPKNLFWFEVLPYKSLKLSPKASKVIDKIISHGCNVVSQNLVGDPYWSTTEISIVPQLIAETTKMIAEEYHES